jgi:tetratricopeptide (TPR) repeat protein
MWTIQRLALCCTAAMVLAGCGTRPAAPPPAPGPVPPEATVGPEAPELPVGPASPAAQQQAQKIAIAAVELLEGGFEDQARIELQRALMADANNRLAHNLLRQMSVDPVAALGRESFAYVVKPGETLSRIAQRHLGDVYSFYILARYNDIRVPKQLAGGQTIRIPGKAPPPTAMEREPRRGEAAIVRPEIRPAIATPESPALPLPAPVAAPPAAPSAPELSPAERALRAAEAAERSGDLDRALADYRRAGDQPGAAEKAEQLRKQLVARYTVGARTAFAKQDLDGTIGQWDRVLELDPNNETAKLERRKAVGLKQKLESVR